MAAAVARPPQVAQASRMTLGGVIRGKQKTPIRLVMYGPEKCGKSTFAAGAPAPIFLDTEKSTEELDVARFEKPETWSDIVAAVRTLTEEPHDYQTLVIDTLDHAEPLLFAEICSGAKVSAIEDVGGGYGRGYTAALDGWRSLLRQLETLQTRRGMDLILLAHSQVRTFKSPDVSVPDHDRYQLKINEKAGGLVKEWCKAVLFCNYETLTAKDAKSGRVKGVDTGVRLIHTERSAAFDAGNRYSLPATLPLSWEDFAAAVAAASTLDAGQLVAMISEKIPSLPEDRREKAAAALAKLSGDAGRLAQLNDKINADLQIRQTEG